MSSQSNLKKTIVSSSKAPSAIGPYSQAVTVVHQMHRVVYSSGQIGLDPESGELVAGGVEPEARRAFANLAAVAEAAGGSLANAVKVTLFLTNLTDFAKVNAIMAELVPQPFPARTTVGVAQLPRGALFEVEAIFVI